jgi:hypothetical protein
MDNKGWISLYRSMQSHPFWKEDRVFSKAEAWIDILMMANHSNNKFLLGSEFVETPRGSFITSELKLISKWKWSKTKVRNYLKLLQGDNMIVKSSDTKKTTLTVVRYCDYQDIKTTKVPKENRESTARVPKENQESTSKEHQKDTNNNDNNYNNENNDKPLNNEKQKVYSIEVNDVYDFSLKHFDEELKPKDEKQKNSWLDTIDKLNRIDGVDFPIIKAVIKNARKDDFWNKQFQSLNKLRSKDKQGLIYFVVFYNKFKPKEAKDYSQEMRNTYDDIMKDPNHVAHSLKFK